MQRRAANATRFALLVAKYVAFCGMSVCNEVSGACDDMKLEFI
jgi:hypothetical protein